MKSPKRTSRGDAERLAELKSQLAKSTKVLSEVASGDRSDYEVDSLVREIKIIEEEIQNLENNQ